MAVKWERLAGDTSKFAFKLSISDDPDQGIGSTAEDSLAWGGFQLWVEEKNLCAHHSQGELVESVHWYLLPLLEWLTANWDPIFHEERLPNQNAEATAEAALQRNAEPPRFLDDRAAAAWERSWSEWWSRHSIEAARQGGVFPSVCLRRWRDALEMSWDSAFSPQRPETVEFLHASGTARIPLADVATPLFEVLREAAAYLSSRTGSPRVHELARRIEDLRSIREERLAWLFGLGATFDEMRQSLRSIREFAALLEERVRRVIFGDADAASLFVRPFPAALMFGAVSPRITAEDRVRLLQSLVESIDENEYPIDAVAAEAPVNVGYSWEQGYRLAEEFIARHLSGAPAAGAVDIEAILMSLGVRIGGIELDDEEIRAVAVAGPEYRPTVLMNREHRSNRHTHGHRFSLAHELCHLLYDRAFAREIALASGPWAPRDVEQRANAFAAMLLMPPDRLAQIVSASQHRVGSRELAHEVANTLRTGYVAAVEHMRNLSFISDDDRDALLEER